MGTLRKLAARMTREADEIETQASDKAVAFALTVIGALAYETPVDTTLAISNWEIGLGSPVSSRRGAFFPGEKGSTYRLSAQAVIKDARAKLATKTPGQSIYISNLQPYIRKLNYEGHSKQGSHFVEVAIMRGRAGLRKNQG